MGQVVISGNTITVYGSQAGARSYWQGMLNNQTFIGAESNTQKQSLVTATRWIESFGLTDPDTGQNITPTIDDMGVPEDVLSAVYELSSALIADPSIRETFTTGGNNNKRLKAGSAEIEFFRPEDGGAFPAQVLRLLGRYLNSGSLSSGEGGGSALGNESFGTDVCQPFVDRQRPNLTEGFS